MDFNDIKNLFWKIFNILFNIGFILDSYSSLSKIKNKNILSYVISPIWFLTGVFLIFVGVKWINTSITIFCYLFGYNFYTKLVDYIYKLSLNLSDNTNLKTIKNFCETVKLSGDRGELKFYFIILVLSFLTSIFVRHTVSSIFLIVLVGMCFNIMNSLKVSNTVYICVFIGLIGVCFVVYLYLEHKFQYMCLTICFCITGTGTCFFSGYYIYHVIIGDIKKYETENYNTFMSLPDKLKLCLVSLTVIITTIKLVPQILKKKRY